MADKGARCAFEDAPCYAKQQAAYNGEQTCQLCIQIRSMRQHEEDARRTAAEMKDMMARMVGGRP